MTGVASLMRILITGAGGFVGAALTSHFASRAETFPLRHADLDITVPDAVDAVFESTRPELVINCAVAGVDGCERDPTHARRVNVDGPAFLARAANAWGAAIIHFSTNYVFGGDRDDGGFYVPDDEAVPINVYGRTKLEGERAVRSQCARSLIVRTSWVFGPNRESFLSTLPRKLRDGERVSAITDVLASATYVQDLVVRVEELFTAGKPGVYHVNNAGVCSYAGFADRVADVLGLSREQRALLIERTTAPARMQIAPRPRWTPMACDRSARIGLPPLRSWQDALDAFIAASAAKPRVDRP